MIPLSKTKLRKKKRNNNSNQDDDDDNDDGGIEHRRHDIAFLDKKQEWCHIIVIVVPGVGVKARKRLSGSYQKKEKWGKRKDLRRRVARLRNVNSSESLNSWSFGYGDEYIIRLG